jgi:hypothetical protein
LVGRKTNQCRIESETHCIALAIPFIGSSRGAFQMLRNTSRSTATPRLATGQKPVDRPTASGVFGRLFRRRPQPTTFQRCLAIHIHFAKPQRGSYG